MRFPPLIVPAILVAGSLFAWSEIGRSERAMATAALESTHRFAESINILRIKELKGTPKDIGQPVYQRLVSQLEALRISEPGCRSLCLLGRREDGSTVVLADGGQAGIATRRTPGQPFPEAEDRVKLVFSSQDPAIEGPYRDAGGGVTLTGLEAVGDPAAALSRFATQDQARAQVRAAIAFYRANGREALLREINNTHGRFCHGELYVFAMDRGMTMMGLPYQPELIGRNLLDVKDWPGGHYFRREIKRGADTVGHGWVNYEWVNPANHQREPKVTYYEAVGDLVLAAGVYKGNGTALAVLAAGFDAHDWDAIRLRSARLPALFTVVLAGLSWIAWSLVARDIDPATARRRSRPWLRPGVVTALGLTVTALIAWILEGREEQARHQAFRELAAGRIEAVARNVRSLRDTELEGLASFVEDGGGGRPETFQQFAGYLRHNLAVSGWEWIPAVAAEDRAAFEAGPGWSRRPALGIWDRDTRAARRRAPARPVYYPVALVSPLEGNEAALGFDLGSEPARRQALQEAMQSRLPTSTEPVTLVQETGTQQGVLICRAVFSREDPGRLRGFALAVVRLRNLLWSGMPDNEVSLEISMIHGGAAAQSLANTGDSDGPVPADLTTTNPILAFGKVFAVTARAGPDFLRRNQLRSVWMTLGVGTPSPGRSPSSRP